MTKRCPEATVWQRKYSSTVSKKSACFALGGFLNADAEDVIRVFQMEGARNTQHSLDNINWEPTLDKQGNLLLLQDIEELLKSSAATEDDTVRKQFHEAKILYLQKQDNEDSTALLEIIDRLRKLKQNLIDQELAKLK